MANAIDKLVISLGLDSGDLHEGLQRASQAIADFGKRVSADGQSLDRLAVSASKSGLLINGVSDEVAERVMAIGTAGQKSALVLGRAMDGISERIGKVGTLLRGVMGPVLAAFAGGTVLSNLSQMGESLSVLSERTGVAVDKIDAWAKANRDAGGSEEAFRSALEQWTVDQGRSADDFFRMGESVKGMSQQQAAYFMRAMGLSQDAAAVFTKFTDKAADAAKAYQGMAMTPEQAKLAREMNIRWRQFTDQAQSLGNMLAVTVLPIVNKVLKAIGDGVVFVQKHSRALKLILGGLGAVLASTYGQSLLKAITTTSTFFKVLKSGQGVMAALNATMLANPIGVVVALVVALGLAIDDLCAFLQGGNSLLGQFLGFIGFSGDQVEAFQKNLGSFLSAIGRIPQNIVSAMKSAWEEIASIGKWFADLVPSIDLSSLGTVLQAGILEPLKALVRGVFAIFDGIEDFFTDLPMRVAGAIGNAVSSIGEAFKAFIDHLGDWIADAFNVGDRVKDAVSGAIKSVQKGVRDALGGVADFFGLGDENDAQSTDGQGAGSPTPTRKADDLMDELAKSRRAVDLAAQPSERGAILDRLGDAIGGFFGASGNQASGAIAASQAKTSSAPAVSNQMEMNVTNNIQTSGSPEEVGKAVGGAMDSALSRRNRMLVSVQSGVISK